MSDGPKDGESFFRKVVRFVANPATDWADINNTRQADGPEFDLEKSELKAMIERKRRNDFVRKREFDMLRRLRREGLSPEQLAALGGSSRIDDSEVRMSDAPTLRPDRAVKDKIDEIEQQMVGEAAYQTTARRDIYTAPTQPAPLPGREVVGRVADDPDRLPALPPLPEIDLPSPASPAPMVMGGGLPPLARADAASAGAGAGSASTRTVFGGEEGDAVEVNEVVHDPELDEAVIAFANADFGQCEQSLSGLTLHGGRRVGHAETWLVLFDLHRATGQQQKFEMLANEYAGRFGLSAPQWFSIPKLVADAATAAAGSSGGGTSVQTTGQIGWICPDVLDTDAVAKLRSSTLQLPLPWVFDWSALKRVEPEAAGQLSIVLRQWAGQQLEMRWIAGDNLFVALADATPTGVRDVDPAYWLARLDALRLANRADQFDEAAIDYCVTYEVSPPSWERARCNVRVSGSSMSTRAPSMSMVSEVSTSFMESDLGEEGHGTTVAHLELSGQLVGDISATLAALDEQLRGASIVRVACGKLIRVDFIAAGDLLNWVLAKRSENRSVTFDEANRLVALFFGAMGINEHAKVLVHRV